MSDLHPTNTMGVEGEVAVKVGTQYFMALNREEREEMEKQRRKASAEMQVSLCVMLIGRSHFLSLLYILTRKVLWSPNSLITNFVLLLPT
jgi:hypothetical protein